MTIKEFDTLYDNNKEFDCSDDYEEYLNFLQSQFNELCKDELLKHIFEEFYFAFSSYVLERLDEQMEDHYHYWGC